MKIVLATRNPHKIREITAIFGDLKVEWVPYSALPDAPALREEGSSLRENAAAKAATGAASSGLVALAEDSALEVDALGGAPGLHSSRFLGEGATEADRIQDILRQLRTYPWHGRTARFRCVVAVARPGGGAEFAEGICDGYIAWEPRPAPTAIRFWSGRGRHHHRGVAQPGSAPALGAGGRRFKSSRPDQF